MHIFQMVSNGLAATALTIGVPAVSQQQAPPQQGQAQQAQQQRPQVVTQFDDTTVRYLLADVQANWRVEQGADGAPVYRANAGEGLNFTLAPRACSPEGTCVGLMMIAVFENVDLSDPAGLDALLNSFNDSNPTAKVLRSPQGVVALQGYVNAAYGISYRNAQAQFLQFGENIVAVSRALAAFEQAG